MRQLTQAETAAVGGAACGDITISVGTGGVSVGMTLGDLADCAGIVFGALLDRYYGLRAEYATGIPNGYPHVG